ncbi:ABC transporter permease subunit [Halobacterium sp. KA-6]|uniref:ABC transporter permease subunit n=1 Tax=Halobacterium sp. KA-6 TaxID=2896368 RepID=UPI001E45BC4C|nr:ABC transporter permease subunit [Halobacterium sp. KA-6]MCD2203059.1 ABC transporter permease subunit [Halobacterium sp. KA-6]
MTWPVVARRDLRALHADNSLAVFGGFFALLAAVLAYGATNGAGVTPLSTALALLFMFAVPLAAGTLTHEAVPSAVASGRVRLTLSLPHSRSTFLAGAGAARLTTTLVAVVAAIVVATVVYALRGAPVPALRVLAVLALAALLAAAFVAATLAFTARSTSTTLAAATTFGFFALALFWPIALSLVRVVLAGQFGVQVRLGLTDLLVVASPLYAYVNALTVVGIDPVATTGSVPDGVGVAVLLAWTLVGFALASRRFARIEL